MGRSREGKRQGRVEWHGREEVVRQKTMNKTWFWDTGREGRKDGRGGEMVGEE